MYAKMLASAAVLLFVVSLSQAEEKSVKGKIKSIDLEKKTLVVTTGKKGAMEDKDFKIAADVKLTVSEGDEKKELVGPEAFKSDKLKVGAKVDLTVDGDKVTAITITMKKK